MKHTRLGLFAFAVVAIVSVSGPLGQQSRFNEALVEPIAWRNLGPFRTGAWISDIAVPDTPAAAHLYTFYVGVRNGGVWKTTNNGTTFESVFDAQSTTSIGAVAVAPSDQNLVWVGTGETYQTRMSYPGDGVYKSADGGKTWANMGLRDSHHISRILIHPVNPNIVYVAAMGHLYSENAERGLFMTVDGGKTWTRPLFVNERTGVIDLVMSRTHPNVMYAATYELKRLPWDLDVGGPGSGIWKTVDGGRKWTRLAGGLPAGRLGRIGLDIYQPNPNILYAVVENANLRPATPEEARRDKERPKPFEHVVGNEVYRTDDGGSVWRKTHDGSVSPGNKAPYSFNIIRVDPGNANHIVVLSDTIPSSEDGGKTWLDTTWPPKRMFPKAFGDVRALWFDPQNPNRILMGSDGGLHISYDNGRTTDHYVNLPVGELWGVGADMDQPYNVYAGMQDHDSWKGPSNGWSGSVTVADWITVREGDGMYNKVDPTDSRWLYNTREFGDHKRVDQTLRTMTDIMPRRLAGQPPLRWNWNTPLAISPHNPQIIYTGAQVLLRSLNRGDVWQEMSPDLTTNDPAKVFGRGNIQHCTITTISESPLTAGVLWVGTDDGRVQVTRTHGAAWIDATAAIVKAGGPADRWVTRVLASGADAATAYVAKSGYRHDDARPYLFKTTDYGATWTSIAANLPDRAINVVVEDAANPRLLFVGTDAGVFATIDGGGRWVRLKGNMPNVPVHDLVIHSRERDLIAGTFGRAIWIADISILEQLDETRLAEDVRVFDIRPRARVRTSGWGNYDFYGDRYTPTDNEPNAIAIPYYLRDAKDRAVSITVSDWSGQPVRTLAGTSRKGLNTVLWNMRNQAGAEQPPGHYRVTVEIGGRTFTTTATIRPPAS
jgi:photosystem II stability/assembly factor-like uncharacterized protein